MEPLPNVVYIVGANEAQRRKQVRLTHIYRTAHDRSVLCVEAIGIQYFGPELAGNRWPRNLSQPQGFPGGQFDRGHLLASQFGAGMEVINLVTMPSSVNRAHSEATS